MISIFQSTQRKGGVYIAVLGTSLIVSVLALSALVLQRLQARLQVASTEMRQAQLNAAAAVELGLLEMQEDENWRTNVTDETWFANRDTGSGACSLEVSDPVDDDLTNSLDDPVLLTGIGTDGQTEQRLALTVYPKRDPLECLRSAIAVGNQINLNADVLRASGLITAAHVTAASSIIYGNVAATTISGSVYNGTTTLVDDDERPEMPDWDTVFDYYRNNGTEIDINTLPTTSPNLIYNSTFESNDDYWTGAPPGIGEADIDQDGHAHSGNKGLKVEHLDGLTSAGAAQYIDGFVEPGEQYYIEAWVYLDGSIAGVFWLTLHTKGTASPLQFVSTSSIVVGSKTWTKLTATLTAPVWAGDLEYSYITVGTPTPLLINKYYLDDVVVRKAATGRYIFRKTLTPTWNPFSLANTNPEGVYWIDCEGNRLIIERSRIHGTLLVVNPGAGSEIAAGPIHWSPAMPGYPALLVDADDATDADFTIRANGRGLSEYENGMNYNSVGSPHDEFGQDAAADDIYASEIRGLVAIEDDLHFEQSPLIRGQIIVGGDISDSSGSLEVEFQPDSLINPPPGFREPYTYERRPGAARMTVMP